MFLLRLKQSTRTSASQAVSRTPQLNFSTALFCVAGLLSVAITPLTLHNSVQFIVNLAFMHLILLLPVLTRADREGIWHSASWAVFFGIMSVIAFVIRLSTIQAVLSEVPLSSAGLSVLIRAIASNWCQLSITGDEIFCTILTVLCASVDFLMSRRVAWSGPNCYFVPASDMVDDQHKEVFGGFRRIRDIGLLILSLPVLGASVVFPTFLCLRELRMQSSVLESIARKKIQ